MITYRVLLLEKMVWRLTKKLERLEGESLATQDARKLVDFTKVPFEPLEIIENNEKPNYSKAAQRADEFGQLGNGLM